MKIFIGFFLFLLSLSGASSQSEISELKKMNLYHNLSEAELERLLKYSPDGFLEFYNDYLSPFFQPGIYEKSDEEINEILNHLGRINVNNLLGKTIEKTALEVSSLVSMARRLIATNKDFHLTKVYPHELEKQNTQIYLFLTEIENQWQALSTERSEQTLQEYNIAMEKFALLKDFVLLETSLLSDKHSLREFLLRQELNIYCVVEQFIRGQRVQALKLSKFSSFKPSPDSLFPTVQTQNNLSVRVLNKQSLFPYFWIGNPPLFDKLGNVDVPKADGRFILFDDFGDHDKDHAYQASSNYELSVFEDYMKRPGFIFLSRKKGKLGLYSRLAETLYRIEMILRSMLNATLFYENFQYYLEQKKMDRKDRNLMELLFFNFYAHENTNRSLVSIIYNFEDFRKMSSVNEVLLRLQNRLDYGSTFIGAYKTKKEDLNAAFLNFINFLYWFSDIHKESSLQCREILSLVAK